MNIGSRLKQILDERHLNVSQLARSADIPAQTLYAMIKRDSNKADMDIMAKLLRGLDMEFMEFMGQDWQKSAKEKVKKDMPEEERPKSEEQKAAREKEELKNSAQGQEKEHFSGKKRKDIEDYLL